MLTLFTVPRSFTGEYARVQLNALKSWPLLHPHIQIILFGNEPGIADTARTYKVDHIAQVAKTKFGTPLLDDVFRKARDQARFPLLMYTNSDMVYLDDLIKSIKHISYPQFLLFGRRYNLDISNRLDFSKSWDKKLLKRLRTESHLYKYGALDYFIFPRSVDFQMPPFAVGRTAWDNWMVYKACALGIPVIDASHTITAVHQNHEYEHSQGTAAIRFAKEKDRNWKLAGDKRKFFNARDATHIMTLKGLQKPALSLKRLIRNIEKFPVLNKSYGFIAEPIIFTIQLVRFVRDTVRKFNNKL